MEATRCSLCSTELTGAIETRCVSLRRVVMITMIETTDCNWKRCFECHKAVCKSCFMSLALRCRACFARTQKESEPSAIQRNGHVSEEPGNIAPLHNPD
jgi:hypothetical protein